MLALLTNEHFLFGVAIGVLLAAFLVGWWESKGGDAIARAFDQGYEAGIRDARRHDIWP